MYRKSFMKTKVLKFLIGAALLSAEFFVIGMERSSTVAKRMYDPMGYLSQVKEDYNIPDLDSQIAQAMPEGKRALIRTMNTLAVQCIRRQEIIKKANGEVPLRRTGGCATESSTYRNYTETVGQLAQAYRNYIDTPPSSPRSGSPVEGLQVTAGDTGTPPSSRSASAAASVV